eukprot:366402-Chlamydomonas_euryale.AAC.12
MAGAGSGHAAAATASAENAVRCRMGRLDTPSRMSKYRPPGPWLAEVGAALLGTGHARSSTASSQAVWTCPLPLRALCRLVCAWTKGRRGRPRAGRS